MQRAVKEHDAISLAILLEFGTTLNTAPRKPIAHTLPAWRRTKEMARRCAETFGQPRTSATTMCLRSLQVLSNNVLDQMRGSHAHQTDRELRHGLLRNHPHCERTSD